eukprot:jgi/Mesen1/5757/ME000292S04849
MSIGGGTLGGAQLTHQEEAASHLREGGGGRGWGRGGGREEEGTDALPELYSVHRATVASVRPFGIFVSMKGYRKQGLVHLSHISEFEVTKRDDPDDVKVKALQEVAAEGDEVWVKVVSMKDEDSGNPKVGCSMKLVNQTDGTDRDPGNAKLQEQQSRPPWEAPKKMELGAVLNVTCTRCGGHGHLKTECYASKAKNYELVPEEEEEEAPSRIPPRAPDRDARAGAGAGAPPPPAGGLNARHVSGPAGRGMAMVQPAWMKHGVGVGGPTPESKPIGQAEEGDGRGSLKKPSKGDALELPANISSVEEAVAVIAQLKAEKKRKKDERRERKERRKREKKKKKRDKKEKRREKKRDREQREKDDEDENGKGKGASRGGGEDDDGGRRKRRKRHSSDSEDSSSDSESSGRDDSGSDRHRKSTRDARDKPRDRRH